MIPMAKENCFTIVKDQFIRRGSMLNANVPSSRTQNS